MNADALSRIAAFYEALSPETLPNLGEIVAEDVHFVDPFNDVTGKAAMIHVFEHMYQTTQDPRFVVNRMAADERGGVLEWTFSFKVRGRPLEIVGTSVVTLNEAGKVASHIDHWDAAGQLFAKLPVIGPIIRWLTRKFEAR